MPRHYHQQVLRRIDDKTLHGKIKVDLPALAEDPAQRGRNGLHHERPHHAVNAIDGQHDGAARNARGGVRIRKIEREMLTPGKRAPRLLVRFHELKPARHADGTRRSVAQSPCSERERILQARCLVDNIPESLARLTERTQGLAGMPEWTRKERGGNRTNRLEVDKRRGIE